METVLKSYRDYQNRRRRLSVCNITPELSEHMDKVEQNLFHNALVSENLRIQDTMHYQFDNRRSQLFNAFTAKDLRNPITRMSWVNALVNAKGR